MVPISVKSHDHLRLCVVSYRNRSNASHDKNRVICGLLKIHISVIGRNRYIIGRCPQEIASATFLHVLGFMLHKGNTCNFFLIHLSYKMRYLKISKIFFIASRWPNIELLLTSVKLSSFHISFRWDRPRTSRKKLMYTIS